jgi:hypothetical protein
MIHLTPQQQQVVEHAKTTLDIVATTTSIAALLNVITGVFALVGTIGSAVWIWMRVRAEHRKQQKNDNDL